MFRKPGYLWSAGVFAGLAIGTGNPLWLVPAAAVAALAVRWQRRH